MKVEELIIDGFKSYAARTSIKGWDSQFNAITGLNGSGKSNILDAICFVLGIQNTSVVRAQNLQDLIYKRGQAGINRASVTIVFDNSDKKSSPLTFESCDQITVTRQIAIGGTSKYLINGHRAQQQNIQSLFQSVNLNINNPNFLIMQGKITKILSMKPPEILAMIEEAAGTRMFEDRKDKAIKTMSKKVKKVEEINELLREEIEPKLERLRNEKRSFIEYQKVEAEVQRLTKLVVAYDYLRSRDKVAKGAAELDAKIARLEYLENQLQDIKGHIGVIEHDMKEIRDRQAKEAKKGGKQQALDKEASEIGKEITRLTTSEELQRANMSEESEKLEETKKNLAALRKSYDSKEKAYQKSQKDFEICKSKYDSDFQEANNKEELIQGLTTGVSSNASGESGYMNQIHISQKDLAKATTGKQQAKMRIEHLKNALVVEEPKADKARAQNKALVSKLEFLKSEIKAIEENLQKMGYSEDMEQSLNAEKMDLEKQIKLLEHKIETLKKNSSNLDFQYSDPYPNFDRTKVKGLVAQLFSIDKENYNKATALEIAAGGRLYNVVVENEDIGKAILSKGKLRKRITLIPLNKIQASTVSKDRVKAAQKLAPGKVDLALTFVGYKNEVITAMEYCFGSSLVCDTSETAKLVTFDPNVRTKCITLDGDVYDPSGTLSGGSTSSGSGVILLMQKINALQDELSVLKSKYAVVNESLEKFDDLKSMISKLGLKRQELSIAEKQLSSNSSTRLIGQVEDMKKEIEKQMENIEQAELQERSASERIKNIEKDMKEFASNKGSKLAQLQKSMENMRKDLAKREPKLKEMQNIFHNAKLEFEQLDGDIHSVNEQIQELNETLSSIQSNLNTTCEQLKQKTERFEVINVQLEQERLKVTRFNGELASLENALQNKNSLNNEYKLELQELGHELDHHKKDQERAAHIVKDLEAQHDWIAEEHSNFGRQGTAFYFGDSNMADLKTQLKGLTTQYSSMKKKVNPKVMNMIDNVEKKEASLLKMVRTVEGDKQKIEDTIMSLDEYKRDALHKTWQKVTVDFGKIFGDLLPGSDAKLEPPAGKEISDGLEVKVALGKVWKESLTELSGGQRSLAALGLIMALLQFKPAPMYILDEVDAALDLSHTQNIGQLIKTRFKGSQFIVVSLKDGLFTNANRLFRTRFVDGTSMVQVL